MITDFDKVGHGENKPAGRINGLINNRLKRPRFDITFREVKSIGSLPPGRSDRPGFFSADLDEDPSAQNSIMPLKISQPPTFVKSNFSLALSSSSARKNQFKPHRSVFNTSRPTIEGEEIRQRREALLESRKKEAERIAREREEQERQRLEKIRIAQEQEQERRRQEQLRLQAERQRQQEEEKRRAAEKERIALEERKKAEEEARKKAQEEADKTRIEELRKKAALSSASQSKPLGDLFPQSSTEKVSDSTEPSKPSLFGSAVKTSVGDDKPTSLFSSALGSPTPEAPTTTLNFGAKAATGDDKPKFSFGSGSASPALGTPKIEPASIFNFKSNPISRSTTPAPAATTGSRAPSGAFTFNLPKPSAPASSVPSATLNPPTTAFSFGSSTPANPADVFKFGGSNGANPTAPPPATPATPAFKFSTAAPTSFNFASKAANPSSVFNFNGASQPPQPSAAPMFGASQERPPGTPAPTFGGFNFNGGNSGAPAANGGSVFGSPAATSTSQAPPAGRKLAPMRRRVQR